MCSFLQNEGPASRRAPRACGAPVGDQRRRRPRAILPRPFCAAGLSPGPRAHLVRTSADRRSEIGNSALPHRISEKPVGGPSRQGSSLSRARVIESRAPEIRSCGVNDQHSGLLLRTVRVRIPPAPPLCFCHQSVIEGGRRRSLPPPSDLELLCARRARAAKGPASKAELSRVQVPPPRPISSRRSGRSSDGAWLKPTRARCDPAGLHHFSPSRMRAVPAAGLISRLPPCNSESCYHFLRSVA